MLRLCLALLPVLTAFCAASEAELMVHELIASRTRDAMVRPAIGINDNVTVNAGFTLINIDVDEVDNKVTLNGWLLMEWNNHRLAWEDEKNLSEIAETRLMPDNMWIPDLLPYNMLPSANPGWILETPAIVKRNGDVILAPPVSFTVRCRRQLNDTADRVTCPIKIGSWTYSEKNLDLQSSQETVDTSNLAYSGHWTVDRSSVTREAHTYPCCPEKYVSLVVELVLKPQRS